MAIKDKLWQIGAELKAHAPFTALGAFTGIALMLLFRNIEKSHAVALFRVFHPAHVVLSAMVTAALFELHGKKKNFLLILIVGYTGSIGVATLSDSIIPFFGESILGVSVPLHADVHKDIQQPAPDEGQTRHEHSESCEHSHSSPKIHLGFIEDWYIVNPAAILGVLIAFLLPKTKLPHAAHILISTWASSAHILMNTHQSVGVVLVFGMFIVLFISVWLPCCMSDIVFPLLFVRSGTGISSTCLCSSGNCHLHTESKGRA